LKIFENIQLFLDADYAEKYSHKKAQKTQRKIRCRLPKLTRRKSKIKKQKAKLWYPKGMIFYDVFWMMAILAGVKQWPSPFD
jgi:hypothetical protein